MHLFFSIQKYIQVENSFSTEYLNYFSIENTNRISKQIENTKSYKLLGMLAVWQCGGGQRNLKSAIRPLDWWIGENQSAIVRSSSRICPKCGGSVRFGSVLPDRYIRCSPLYTCAR